MSSDPTPGGPPDAGPTTGEPGQGGAQGASVEPRPRRKHRRAVGGTVPPSPEPRSDRRTPDDLDVAWGDQPPGSDDERFLREVPPHW